MRRILHYLVAGAALVPGLAFAQGPQRNLLDITCGQYLTALSIANPPAKPSGKQSVLAQDAQDDIADGLLWIHGYLAGKAVAAGKPLPALTKDWMASYVPILADSCKAASPNGDMLLTEIVARL